MAEPHDDNPGRPWLHVRHGEPRKVTTAIRGYDFVVPPDGDKASFQDHQNLVAHKGSKYGFNPEKFAFDSALAYRYTNSADRGLTVKKAKNYQQHAVLRDNIATLRNVLMAMYFDEELSPAEQKSRAKAVQNMATRLGRALRDNKIPGASNRDIGAAELYRYLDMHRAPGLLDRPMFFGWLVSRIGNKNLARRIGIEWDLPPIELSPFHNEAHQAARLYGGRSQKAIIEQLAADAAAMRQQAARMDHIENLPEQPRANSVEEARKILDWLRNLHLQQGESEKGKAEPDERLRESDQLLELLQLYRETLAHAGKHNPGIVLHESMQRAKMAFVSLSDMLDAEQSLMRTKPSALDYEGREEALEVIAAAITYAEQTLLQERVRARLPKSQAAAATQATTAAQNTVAAARITAAPPEAVRYADEFNRSQASEREGTRAPAQQAAVTGP